MELIDKITEKPANEYHYDIPSDVDIKKSTDVIKQIDDIHRAIGKTEKLADLLDNKWLEAIIGWLFEMAGLPIIGDIPSAIAGLYIVLEAKKAGLPNTKIVHMLANVGLDFAVDIIPVLGNIADFFVKSNVANVKIMKKYAEELERKHGVAQELPNNVVSLEDFRKRKKMPRSSRRDEGEKIRKAA